MRYFTLAPTNIAPKHQRQIEPILMRVVTQLYVPEPFVVRRFKLRRFQPIGCTSPMVYGTNGSPRDRMRHQVQLSEGAPGWRGRMPTDRYQRIG